MIAISFEHVNVAQNRYLYNGKELQDQAIGGTPFGWYDYGRRFYDPDGARFMSVDPLAEKYYFQSVYAYAANNPIRFIDWMGMGPGDPFPTKRAAAKDWAKTYNGASIILKKEFGSTIYEVKKEGKVVYSYNEPTIGEAHSVAPNADTPKGTKTVADIHSHGNDDERYNDNNFSGIPKDGSSPKESTKGDIGSNNAEGTTGYVSTPNGSLQEYNPTTGKIETISKDNPSDPKDPERLNKNAPVPTKPIYHIPNNLPTNNK